MRRKSWLKGDEVRRRIPKGCELPARFDDFLRAGPPFSVVWSSLDAYGLKRSAAKEAVPFLRLPDGGLVAFWYRAASPAVVHIGAHGELQVIAHDFDDFLKSIGAKCSGLPDFDEEDQAFRVPGVNGRPKKASLPTLQQEFEQWFKMHTSLQEPLETRDTEALRRRVHEIAEEMLRDGCSKVYTLSSTWWSMDFQIEIDRTKKQPVITYLTYGKWYPVPKKYKLGREVAVLLTLVKHKKRKRYELSTCRAGIVSIDRDRELVLVPPDFEPD